jgi:hypothetical protein
MTGSADVAVSSVSNRVHNAILLLDIQASRQRLSTQLILAVIIIVT